MLFRWKEVLVTHDFERYAKAREVLRDNGIQTRGRVLSHGGSHNRMRGMAINLGGVGLRHIRMYYIRVPRKDAQFAGHIIGGIR